MASIHKTRKSRNWQASIKVWTGERWKWVLRSTGTDDAERAKRIADTMQKTAMLGHPDKFDRAEAFRLFQDFLRHSGQLSPSWDDVAQQWLDMRAERVKRRTLETYASRVKMFASWIREGLAVAEIDVALAQRFYDDQIHEGRSPQTMAGALATLSEIHRRAVALGYAENNPWPSVERRIKPAREREPFSADDIEALIAGSSGGMRTLIYLGAFTGARLTDCVNMGWGNVDLQRVAIEFQQGKKSNIGGTVILPLHGRLLFYLLSLPSRSGLFCPVFHARHQRQPHRIAKEFNALVDSCGIRYHAEERKGAGRSFRSKTFHSFRHSLASRMYAQGVPEETRMRLLDHDTKAIHRRYSHADLDALRKAINTI